MQAGLARVCMDFEDWIREMGEGRLLGTEEKCIAFIDLPEELKTRGGIEVHSPFPPGGCGIHLSQYLGDCLGVPLSALESSPLKNLLCPRSESDTPKLWIHPGAGGKEKRWDLESFIRIAVEIGLSGRLEVQFLLGEADLDLAERLAATEFRIIMKERIVDLARVWKTGDIYLGNDSGVTHLAGLCGLETIAMFGPTDARIWRPLGERVHLLSGRNKDSMPEFDEVRQTVREICFGKRELESL